MRNICSVEDCKALVIGNGLCKKHYHRMRRTGTTDLIDRRTFCECGKPAVAFGLCDMHYRHTKAEDKKAARRDARGERICAWCSEMVPVERRAKAIYCGPECKKHAMNERARQRPAAVERSHADHYRRTFGISLEEHAAMLEAQGGRCAICRSDKPGGRGRFAVDHCHSSGRVRGLLCVACNAGLGQFRDDPDLLRAAVAYLAVHRP